MGVRPRLRDLDVCRNGIRAEARANLGKGAGQVALDVLDIGGARVDRCAGKSLEQHRGAIEVIEVRMRDENGLEAPPFAAMRSASCSASLTRNWVSARMASCSP